MGLIPSLTDKSLNIIALLRQLPGTEELNLAVGPFTLIFVILLNVSIHPKKLVVIRVTL